MVKHQRLRGLFQSKVFQSMALKKAVITSDTPAIREIFEPMIHYYPSLIGDANSLYEAINTLANDNDLRKAIADFGYTQVKEKFTMARIGKELIKIFELRLKGISIVGNIIIHGRTSSYLIFIGILATLASSYYISQSGGNFPYLSINCVINSYLNSCKPKMGPYYFIVIYKYYI